MLPSLCAIQGRWLQHQITNHHGVRGLTLVKKTRVGPLNISVSDDVKIKVH